MDGLLIAAVTSVVTGILTGVLSSFGTVSALKVHIAYLRETLSQHNKRIIEIERNQRTLRSSAPVSGD